MGRVEALIVGVLIEIGLNRLALQDLAGARAPLAEALIQALAEGLRLAPAGIEATVLTVEELGSDSYLYCTPSAEPDVTVVARTDGLTDARPGEVVHLQPDVSALHVFDTNSGARLED